MLPNRIFRRLDVWPFIGLPDSVVIPKVTAHYYQLLWPLLTYWHIESESIPSNPAGWLLARDFHWKFSFRSALQVSTYFFLRFLVHLHNRAYWPRALQRCTCLPLYRASVSSRTGWLPVLPYQALCSACPVIYTGTVPDLVVPLSSLHPCRLAPR
ncbi:hypothetical protein BH23BAC2_BH23BAC2_19020 [soil metagenome]